MDMMKCLGGRRLQFFLTLFARATPGTPASLCYFNNTFETQTAYAAPFW